MNSFSSNKTFINLLVILTIIYYFLNTSETVKYIAGGIDKFIYQSHSNGWANLIYSPMKIPANASISYCSQFTDSLGNKITTITYFKDSFCCGTYWGLNPKTTVTLPFRVLPNGKVEYWASPTMRIISSKN